MNVRFWLGVAALLPAGSIWDAPIRRRRECAFMGVPYVSRAGVTAHRLEAAHEREELGVQSKVLA